MNPPSSLTSTIPAPLRRGSRLAEQLRTFGTWIDALSGFELAARMTLLLLIFYGGNYWYLRVPIAILGIAGMLHAQLRRGPDFWLAVTAVMVIGNIPNWHVIDNHKYLMTYWCLAMGCAALTSDPDAALARSARWLIGLAFGFAIVWKLISDDYGNGTFFHHALLLDGRFDILARWFGGLDEAALAHNRAAISDLTANTMDVSQVALQTTPRVLQIAWFLTIWTVAIELLVAALFLLPPTWRLSRHRNAALLLFLASTYCLAPVIGFGWILAIMGATQARPGSHSRLAYVGIFFLLQLYRIPWQKIVLGYF